MIRDLVFKIASIGADPNDSADTRLQKSLLVFSSLMMASLAVVWSSVYFAYREYLAGAIPLVYSILSFLSLGWFASTRQYALFLRSQLLFPLVLPFLLMLASGGIAESGVVVLWSLTSPLGALLFLGRRQAIAWFLAYIALVIVGAVLEPFNRVVDLPSAISTAFHVMNICGVSIVAFVLLQYFMSQKEAAFRLLHLEQDKSENLLLNIFPTEVANRLKNQSQAIADRYESASILFADLVNFTPMSEQMPAQEVVGLLNEVFSYLDGLTEKYGLEKIKTIGDCYMVAAGVPRPRVDHAQILTRMALEMCDYVSSTRFLGKQLVFRTGINSGPVVAGVIGRKKFSYDLWGDTVNTASRMGSHGAAGAIQITQATYDLIKDDFVCEARGRIDVKGKGEMNVWYVLEERA